LSWVCWAEVVEGKLSRFGIDWIGDYVSIISDETAMALTVVTHLTFGFLPLQML
jgi:hypothetical protein